MHGTLVSGKYENVAAPLENNEVDEMRNDEILFSCGLLERDEMANTMGKRQIYLLRNVAARWSFRQDLHCDCPEPQTD